MGPAYQPSSLSTLPVAAPPLPGGSPLLKRPSERSGKPAPVTLPLPELWPPLGRPKGELALRALGPAAA